MQPELYLAVCIREVETAAERLKEAKARIIEERCPIKIGDVVETNGYSHKGKRFRVEHIIAKDRLTWKQDGDHEFEFRATGPIIKKNGEPGQQHGEHSIRFKFARAK